MILDPGNHSGSQQLRPQSGVIIAGSVHRYCGKALWVLRIRPEEKKNRRVLPSRCGLSQLRDEERGVKTTVECWKLPFGLEPLSLETPSK